MDQAAESPPIINCHTHVFTVKDVPPMLARTIAPWPLYFLIRTGWIAGLVKWWGNRRFNLRQKKWYKQLERSLYQFRMALKRYFILRLLKLVTGMIILASIFHDQWASLLKPWLAKQGVSLSFLDRFDEWLAGTGLLIITSTWLVKMIVLAIFLLLFPVGRNLLFAVLRQFNRFFKLLPGKQTSELLKRYIQIVRFANYKEQSKVYSRLLQQYPPGTKMVVLPMDMEFMGAGKPGRPYHEQMEMLASIKKNHPGDIYPFLFVDPRRTHAGGKLFFSYKVINQKVVLEDCFVKDFIESKDFAGFKIYPALGYFPFDERLLPIWKYAADNGIPIMTHCIRGVIYYRGRKQKNWDFHPVFEESAGKGHGENNGNEFRPLLLPQMKAVDVQEIFTHPLNYTCLYKKELLKKLIAGASDPRIKELFGYNATDDTLQRGLSHLKLCFGHFGGEDEWLQFFEKDRSNYGHQLIQFPDQGIEFLTTGGKPMRGKLEQLWKNADWYSIICSLMLQHDHVYADISYILHGDLQILPLLRHTLQHPRLKTRVLYGSDFYVVRNHKSDKNMLADIKGGLLKNEFDQIARVNPVKFLAKGVQEES
ncbi:MAG: hypothetical protein ABIR30_01460 [Chitinophagaceae bacterium]